MPGSEPATMSFAALSGTVRVEWQRQGLVHIRAESEADLFFAQGYVSSRLRLWEMEVQRRIVAGRLAEVVGSPVSAIPHGHHAPLTPDAARAPLHYRPTVGVSS